MEILISQLLELLDGTLLSGQPDTKISGFASLKEAVAGDLSFFSDTRYRERFDKTKASAVLVPQDWTAFPPNMACLAVANPSVAFQTVADKFGMQPERPKRHSRPGPSQCGETFRQIARPSSPQCADLKPFTAHDDLPHA